MTLKCCTLFGLFLIPASVAVYGGALAPDECPMAMIVCEDRPVSKTKYRCYAAYHVVKDHPVKLKWGLSRGKIIRTDKPGEIIIDARHVKTKTILVTLKAHWKDLEVCDKTVTNTIQLPD